MDETNLLIRTDRPRVILESIKAHPPQVQFQERITKDYFHGIRSISFAPEIPFANPNTYKGISIRKCISIQTDEANQLVTFKRADGKGSKKAAGLSPGLSVSIR